MRTNRTTRGGKTETCRAVEMAQRVNVFAYKGEDLSLITGSHLKYLGALR